MNVSLYITALALAGTIGCETRGSCQTLVSVACNCETGPLCETAEILSNNGDKDACDTFYDEAVPGRCKGEGDTGYYSFEE